MSKADESARAAIEKKAAACIDCPQRSGELTVKHPVHATVRPKTPETARVRVCCKAVGTKTATAKPVQVRTYQECHRYKRKCTA